MISLVVPTRNNPQALATLLGSVLASCHSASGNSMWKPSLFLMDGSDSPVITHSHLARLLTRFDLTYMHFLRPNVNMQRLHGIRRHQDRYKDEPFILIDDDHVLVADPIPALVDMRHDTDANAYFGVCVDILNDKGYPDYSFHSSKVKHHSFIEPHHTPTGIGCVPCQELIEFSANPGFLVSKPSKCLEKLAQFHGEFTAHPAIADDAWAKALANPPILHTALQAMHVGNNNGWWGYFNIKHAAVQMAVEKVK